MEECTTTNFKVKADNKHKPAGYLLLAVSFFSFIFDTTDRGSMLGHISGLMADISDSSLFFNLNELGTEFCQYITYNISQIA